MPRTIFFPAKSKRIADLVRIDSPTAARRSAIKLLRLFNRAKTKARRRQLKRAAVLAANRARVISRNPRVSQSERAEMRSVARIYRAVARRMVISRGRRRVGRKPRRVSRRSARSASPYSALHGAIRSV